MEYLNAADQRETFVMALVSIFVILYLTLVSAYSHTHEKKPYKRAFEEILNYGKYIGILIFSLLAFIFSQMMSLFSIILIFIFYLFVNQTTGYVRR